MTYGLFPSGPSVLVRAFPVRKRTDNKALSAGKAAFAQLDFTHELLERARVSGRERQCRGMGALYGGRIEIYLFETALKPAGKTQESIFGRDSSPFYLMQIVAIGLRKCKKRSDFPCGSYLRDADLGSTPALPDAESSV